MRVSVPRWLIVLLAAVFSCYHLVLAGVSLDRFDDPWPVLACMVAYATATVAALWPSRRAAMPAWTAAFALAVSVVIPLQITSQLDPGDANGYATWYVAAIGTLMVIVATRRRQWFAWLGVGFMAVHGVAWSGLGSLADLGVVGSVTWVAFATAISSTLTRASRETREFILAEHEAADWQAAQEAHINERQYRLVQTGRTARPMLLAIVAQDGDLTPEQRQECLNLEGAIRDEIRGRRLLDDDVRREVMAARRRGAVVSLLDEGGIDDIEGDELARIHRSLAEALHGSTADRIIIRTVPGGGDDAVTVVGLGSPDLSSNALGRAGSVGADEDDDDDEVQLWLQIPRSSDDVRA
ncbi:hypothetical protein [Frigoribacterium faeni]|uniref:Uncharacterized protein n=1 Tax=Frigoribacterium faeni TaxID=145483 RepID=A0A7W3JG58_9MICO|nr:hypothetical protein [Frigoribacterium faeni]MBA8812267.1 hypothetical protein [Frigoribacterium faeni]GEK83161.1 hypothetical protein FFA01_14700 [Frigoribacterium faeni]